MKNWKKTSMLLFIFITIILSSYILNVKADYPILSGENVLDINELSSDSAEIFTLINGEYHKKLLKNIDNKWIIEKDEKLELRKTGLKTENTGTKDSSLGKSLETKLKSSGFNLSALPSKVNYSNSLYLPPIGQQQLDDCVAWSTGYYVRTFQQAKDMGWNAKDSAAPLSSHVFSPSFIYNQINGGADNGATLEDAGNLLENVGAATLADFPYIASDYTTQPSNSVKAKAAVNKIKEWSILYTYKDSDDYILQKTKEYLNTGDILVAGMEIGYRFEYPTIRSDGTSIITTDKSSLGGHAIAVVGYDDSIVSSDGTGAFILANSWGTSWGNKGFSYISYRAFLNDIIKSVVFTDLPNDKIVGDIPQVNYEILSAYKFKLSWNAAANAIGYNIYDENNNLINMVTDTSYTETLSYPGTVIRYVQPYNSTSTGSLTKVNLDTSTAASNLTAESLPVQIINNVKFNINFTGTGYYSFIIKDSNGNLVNQQDNLYATTGASEITWSCKDSSGNEVEDGEYSDIINTSSDGKINQIYSGSFNKESKVTNADATIYRNNYEIESVIVNLTPKIDTTLKMDINSNGTLTNIINSTTIKANTPFTYTISKDKFNFNNIDLSKSYISLSAN